MRVFFFLFFLFFLTTASVQAEELSKERFSSYTVFIENRISQPFFEDSNKNSLRNGVGIIIDKDRGWILSTATTIGYSPSKVKVSTHNRLSLDAEKIYVDPFLDLAIIQVDPKKLPFFQQNAVMNCDGFGELNHPITTATAFRAGLFTFQNGKILSLPNGDKGKFLKADLITTNENVGAPLVSMKDGRIMGILSDEKSAKVSKFSQIVPALYTCKIVSLLKEGIDPSPPELPILFYVPEPSEQKLIVARSFFQNKTIELKAGDEILNVKGQEKFETTHVGKLVHALRGQIDDFTLSIKRDGNIIDVKGSAEPHGLITKRKGVKFSGILIAPFEKEDRGLLEEYDYLQMHHVDKGSVAEKLKFGNLCVIMSVDGKKYKRLDDLYDYLKGAEAQRKNVELEVRWPKKRAASTYFTYMKRSVPVEDLKWIQ